MRSFLVLALALLFACGEDADIAPSAPATSSASAGGAGGSGTAGGGAVGNGGNGAGGATGGDGGMGGTPIPCPDDGLVPGEQQMQISFDGNMRQYEVQIPLSYDGVTRVPLVFDLHGYTSNKDQQELVSGIADKAESEGFVVVRPNGFGTVRSWNAGDACCGTAQSQDLDDVGLMKAIVTEVTNIGCIDPKRVYATGISNGGALSHRLACEAADVFAAVAPVAYPIDRDPLTQCQPSRPIAVMHLHGVNDLIVPYDGGGIPQAQPTPDSFAYWGQANGCTDMPSVTYSKGSSVCETHDSCGAGVEVTLCSINGGHVLYSNGDDVPVDGLVWSFLSRFTLP